MPRSGRIVKLLCIALLIGDRDVASLLTFVVAAVPDEGMIKLE
jgi:hypothetical protein